MTKFRLKKYEKLENTEHVVIDCATQESTIFTLSHWPLAKTLNHFKADTSSESVFKFL